MNSKDKSDQTGFENLVWENYASKQADWIPFKDVDPADDGADEVAEAAKKQQDEAEEFRKSVKANFEQLAEKFDKIEKTLEKLAAQQPPEQPQQ